MRGSSQPADLLAAVDQRPIHPSLLRGLSSSRHHNGEIGAAALHPVDGGEGALEPTRNLSRLHLGLQESTYCGSLFDVIARHLERAKIRVWQQIWRVIKITQDQNKLHDLFSLSGSPHPLGNSRIMLIGVPCLWGRPHFLEQPPDVLHARNHILSFLAADLLTEQGQNVGGKRQTKLLSLLADHLSPFELLGEFQHPFFCCFPLARGTKPSLHTHARS